MDEGNIREIKMPEDKSSNNLSELIKKTKELANNVKEEKDTKEYDLSFEEEMRNLRKNNLDQSGIESGEIFILKNKRTGKIVELKANSALEAVRALGWRPRHSVQIN
jgi:hypothetical protein